MLGVHREFGRKRSSRGTREGGEQTRRNDGKRKHEEEHVEPMLNTGNRLKISIEEFSWEREGDGSTLGMEETEQQEIVYIMNLDHGLRKDGTTLYDEEGPNKKSLLRETSLLKCPP